MAFEKTGGGFNKEGQSLGRRRGVCVWIVSLIWWKKEIVGGGRVEGNRLTAQRIADNPEAVEGNIIILVWYACSNLCQMIKKKHGYILCYIIKPFDNVW